MLGNKQLPVAIDFHSMEGKNTVKVNGDQQQFGYQHSLKYLLLCSTEGRNYTVLEQRGWTINLLRVAQFYITNKLIANILWIWTYVRLSWAKLVSLFCFIDRLLTLIMSITLRIVWRPVRGTGQKCLERTACSLFLPAPATRRYCKCTCVGAYVCFWLDKAKAPPPLSRSAFALVSMFDGRIVNERVRKFMIKKLYFLMPATMSVI